MYFQYGNTEAISKQLTPFIFFIHCFRAIRVCFYLVINEIQTVGNEKEKNLFSRNCFLRNRIIEAETERFGQL